MPQLARHGAGVEEVRADGDHHVHITRLDDLPADLLFAVPGAGGLGGHDEVALAGQDVLVLVVGDGLGDLSLQPVDREVHLGDADCVAVLLLAVEDDLLRRVATLMLDEVAGLDEHPARTAGRVEHDAVIGLADVDDRLHERRGGEELAVVVRFLDGELGEEIFIDAAKNVTRRLFDLFAIEKAHQVFEDLCFEDVIISRQDAGERLEL